uniref:Uncharacterized protein n=1 Tax=Tanacetum cinerariifolium TaxID=118510 RepID=A0A6L2NV89_TANCI|nr:hypothetical protein [Tanacetum cinerariifolium]
MFKNDMKDRICTLSKNDLKDLVKTYHIPLDLHPCLPGPGFTMDRLPADAIEMSMYDFMTLPSWSDAKIVEESHHLSLLLHERVSSHTIVPASEGAIISLPTLDEIATSQPDSRLVKKSKGHSQASRPSKRRKLQKRASEIGSSDPELDQADGADETNLADLCAEIEDSLERDKGVSIRVVLAPTPRLGKRLGAPPSIAITSVYDPSHVGTSALASTSGRSLTLRGVVAGGHVGKSKAQMGKIPNDDFSTTTRGEEINLTLFPLAPGPYHMSYPYKGISSPLYSREEWNGRHALESNIICEDIFKDLDENRELRSQRDDAFEEVWKLQSQPTDAKTTSISLSQELTRIDAKLSEQALTVKDLQNEIVLEKSKSREYKEDIDGLREEVTQFVGSGVESLVQKLLSSDEFHVSLARVASLDINYGVERGLHMGCTNVEFEAVVQKVSNFCVGAKADFDKALDDFPTTPFPFLSKIVVSSEGGLPDSFRGRGKTLRFHPSTGELTCFFLSPLLELIVSSGGSEPSDAFMFSWIQKFKFIRSASLFSSSDLQIVLLVGMPISAGMTASVPYVRLNGVSPLLVLGVVLLALSIAPFAWGWYTDVDTSFIPNTSAQDLNGSLINWVSLSFMMVAGISNLHMMLSNAKFSPVFLLC